MKRFLAICLLFTISIYADERIKKSEGVSDFTGKLTKKGSDRLIDRWGVDDKEKMNLGEKKKKKDSDSLLKGFFRDYDKYDSK